MTSCNLCDPQLGPIIAESEHWRIVLNRNQNLLGKCFLVTRRHLEAVSALTSPEWRDLHGQMTRTTLALQLAFHPDHFNYAFLQNQDRHVHLHVIPRYAGTRMFAGTDFADPDYPDHYAVPTPVRALAMAEMAVLVEQLRRGMAEAVDAQASSRRCSAARVGRNRQGQDTGAAAVAIPVMVLTGPVGVGKSAVAAAVSELLDRAGMRHAMADLDYLRWHYPTPADDPFRIALGLRNLAAVWVNYRAAGAERLVLADVVESRLDLEGYREAVPDAAILVVRLTATLTTIGHRLTERETGDSLDWYCRRAAELDALMERTRVEDLLVDTEGKPAAIAAREAVIGAHWLERSELPDP